MNDALLSCPFCGGKARLRKRQMRFWGYRDNSSCGGGGKEHVVDYGFQVICNKCKARGPLFVRSGWTSEEICSEKMSQFSTITEETLREMIEELDRLVCTLSEEEKAVVEEARKELV